MSEVWIANASPVIVLAKAGCVDLLEQLSAELVIPQAVVEEILRGPISDPARQLVESGWGVVVSPTTVPVELLEWGLGLGETAVLALAQERTLATAILDDAAARTCAKAIGIPVIGTLGVILRAKRRGHVESAAEVIRAVRDAGLHLDDEVIRSALGRVGETWQTFEQ
ncbi:MAG: DUF3368 domain-containing protein [Planctomycetia bacterium]|nr:DUF3368 domain-containing protein [Planctomycetia bacterium]